MANAEKAISRGEFITLSALAVPVVAESVWAFNRGQEIERKRRSNISSAVNNIVLNLQNWEREVTQYRSPLVLGAAATLAGRKVDRRQFLKLTAGETALFAGITALGSEIGGDVEANRQIFIEGCIDKISAGLTKWLNGVRAVNPELLKDQRVSIDRKDLPAQYEEEYPPFDLHNEGNVTLPLLSKLKKGKTVILHLSGVGSTRPDGVGSYQSELHIFEPWIKKYFQAQGCSKEEAAQKTLELVNNVMSYKDTESQGLRLGAQIEAMLEMGIVFLPWEMVPDNSPIAMSLLAAAFIKNLPPGTEVILTGHSLGALAVRSFLKMYQEGFLDSALIGKELISTISSNEAFPGDTLMSSLYEFSEQFKAHSGVAINTMDFFNQWVKRLFIDSDATPADIKIKYKEVLEGNYDLQKAFEQSDPIPKLTLYLAGKASEMLGDPYYYLDIDAAKVNSRGTRVVSIYSPQDVFSVNAQIRNAIEICVNINLNLNGIVDRVTIRHGRTDIPFSIPTDLRWAISHVGERAHWPFSEVSDLILNTI